MRLIDSFDSVGLKLCGVVITKYNKQSSSDKLRKKLEKAGYQVAYHYTIPNYPNDADTIISEKGFGKNEYIKTTRDIVVVTAPGPGSGKMATCLSQMYHDNLKGIKAGYAKFETFPVWDLPLNHPINLAYEAATIDLDDVNMLDPFHFEAYKKIAVNYNRDVETFPILNELLIRILGKQVYKSPTDMGVNMISQCITDDIAYLEKCEINRKNSNERKCIKDPKTLAEPSNPVLHEPSKIIDPRWKNTRNILNGTAIAFGHGQKESVLRLIQ